MRSIEIDFEVFKALTARRASEEVTYNDVIRALLGLNGAQVPDTQPRARSAWTYKGVDFPIGTDFRATYKGKVHYGSVEAGGLVVQGQAASSPSDAARAITGNNVNGWAFWECRFPGETQWKPIMSLRRQTARYRLV